MYTFILVLSSHSDDCCPHISVLRYRCCIYPLLEIWGVVILVSNTNLYLCLLCNQKGYKLSGHAPYTNKTPRYKTASSHCYTVDVLDSLPDLLKSLPLPTSVRGTRGHVVRPSRHGPILCHYCDVILALLLPVKVGPGSDFASDWINGKLVIVVPRLLQSVCDLQVSQRPPFFLAAACCAPSMSCASRG